MMVCTAVCNITPGLPTPTFARQADIAANFLESRLEANLIILAQAKQYLVLINIDSVFSSQALEISIREKVEQECDPDIRWKFIIVATHSHNTPLLDPRFTVAANNIRTVIEDTAQSISSGILTACKNPARFYSMEKGLSRCPGAVYRRLRTWVLHTRGWPPFRKSVVRAPDTHRKIPDQLTTFIARDNLNNPLFVIWHWQCHATAYPNPDHISSDFPGVVRDHIRQLLHCDTAVPIIYLPGFSGDIRPDISSWFFPGKARLLVPFAKLFKPSQKKYRKFCSDIKNSVAQALSNTDIISRELVPKIKTASVDLHDIFDGDCPDSFEICRISLSANGPELLLVQAEVCYQYEEVPSQLFKPNTISSGLMGQIHGYLPTNQQLLEGGYEASEFIRYFPLDGQYQKKIEQHITDRIGTLFS